jgi:hypothetical protein
MNALTRWDPFKEMEETQNRLARSFGFSPAMNKKPQQPSRKFGANRKEFARNARKRAANFAQSRDIREDRGERQMKSARARQTMAHFARAR